MEGGRRIRGRVRRVFVEVMKRIRVNLTSNMTSNRINWRDPCSRLHVIGAKGCCAS